MTTVSLVDIPVVELELPRGTEVVSGNDVYLIQEQLGRGGFGVVYRATLAGIDYALKIATGESAKKQLFREAKITAALSKMHLGVFPLMILQNTVITLPYQAASGTEGGEHLSHSAPQHPLRTLEQADFAIGIIRDMSRFGVAFSSLLAQNNSLSETIGVMLTILRVLQPIHETKGLQYLHGDISPENIVYVPDADAAVFIDFGSARQLGQDGRALIPKNEFSYNPVFMSPEIRAFVASPREAISLSKASDIYSLGMIFYGLLFEPPNEAYSEHIAVLARNRINRSERTGVWSKTICQLLMGLFEDCLAVSEEARIQNLAELNSRLCEIRELLDNRDITKTSIYNHLLARAVTHTAESRFSVCSTDEKGQTIDLISELSDVSAHTPVFLSGGRGSGKTTLLHTTARRLLDTKGPVPVAIGANELQETLHRTDMPRALATAAYHNIFGYKDPPQPQVVAKLMAVLGLHSASDGEDTDGCDGGDGCSNGGGTRGDAEAGADSAEAPSVPGSKNQLDFILLIDNSDLLERYPLLILQLADTVRATTKTRFVFCENAAFPCHNGRNRRHDNNQEQRLNLQDLVGNSVSCSMRPLAVREVQEYLRKDHGIQCPEHYTRALTAPALLALLYEELEDRGLEAQRDTELALSMLYRVFERFYRYGQDPRFEETTRLAYVQLAIKRHDLLIMPADAELTQWLFCEGVARPLLDKGDTWLFASSAVGDFFASQFVAQTIRRAAHATHLSEINHVWHKGLIAMLGALPVETLAALSSKTQRLIKDASTTEASHCDLIPSNMFALTGDDSWTRLSVGLADSFFHDTVLDGYFAHHREIILVSDAEREHPIHYSLLESNTQELQTQLSTRLLQALVADLRYGYRLTQNHELADRLER
jgi:serine/threonine protein kinase